MGIAASTVRLLTLTARKSTVELGMTKIDLRLHALQRETSKLAEDFNRERNSKRIAYYSNGQYIDVDYPYLMGSSNILNTVNGGDNVKSDSSMILADFNNRVVLSDLYANAIIAVLGNSAMDAMGRGGTFDADKIPEIIASIHGMPYTADEFRAALENEYVNSSYSAHGTNLYSGESGSSYTHDDSDSYTARIMQYLRFYMPIFQAASVNGWTREYNDEMAQNPSYVSDALGSGSFILTSVDTDPKYGGQYVEGTSSLTYFITSGAVVSKSDYQTNQALEIKYNAAREEIKIKEDLLTTEKLELSSELESIKTEIESLDKRIQNDIQETMRWCAN